MVFSGEMVHGILLWSCKVFNPSNKLLLSKLRAGVLAQRKKIQSCVRSFRSLVRCNLARNQMGFKLPNNSEWIGVAEAASWASIFWKPSTSIADNSCRSSPKPSMMVVCSSWWLLKRCKKNKTICSDTFCAVMVLNMKEWSRAGAGSKVFCCKLWASAGSKCKSARASATPSARLRWKMAATVRRWWWQIIQKPPIGQTLPLASSLTQ